MDFESHPHLKARMSQRGVEEKEIDITLKEGWEAKDAKEGTLGKTMVFPYAKEWEDKYYNQKEVTVYYKILNGEIMILTVKARYGNKFKRELI